MNHLNYQMIRDFYNKHTNCWSSELFSQMTTEFIDKYVNKVLGKFDVDAVVLNAGSGGKIYKTKAKQIHIDIAENTLHNIDNSFVGNIIDMPFGDDIFDCVVCVGTVINYCEIEKAIKEINRVSKEHALLILEYERSGSGLVAKKMRNEDSTVFHHTYFNEPHINLLYSDSYVNEILSRNGYYIKNLKRFNTTIPWLEMFTTEKIAHKMSTFEPIFRSIPVINKYSHNGIICCEKINRSMLKCNRD